MNGSLTLLDDNLLYIAFSIIGISSKNDQKMKFSGRGVGHCPIRSLSHLKFYQGGEAEVRTELQALWDFCGGHGSDDWRRGWGGRGDREGARGRGHRCQRHRKQVNTSFLSCMGAKVVSCVQRRKFAWSVSCHQAWGGGLGTGRTQSRRAGSHHNHHHDHWEGVLPWKIATPARIDLVT